jgi:hypothetical protein
MLNIDLMNHQELVNKAELSPARYALQLNSGIGFPRK